MKKALRVRFALGFAGAAMLLTSTANASLSLRELARSDEEVRRQKKELAAARRAYLAAHSDRQSTNDWDLRVVAAIHRLMNELTDPRFMLIAGAARVVGMGTRVGFLAAAHRVERFASVAWRGFMVDAVAVSAGLTETATSVLVEVAGERLFVARQPIHGIADIGQDWAKGVFVDGMAAVTDGDATLRGSVRVASALAAPVALYLAYDTELPSLLLEAPKAIASAIRSEIVGELIR